MEFPLLYLSDVKARLEAQTLVIQQMEESLKEKERTCAEKINAIREEEFQKVSAASHEKCVYSFRLVENSLSINCSVHKFEIRGVLTSL